MPMSDHRAPSALPISVCMLVKNEMDRLPRTLAALAEFAEIVVLDSGSADGSVDYARNHGCVVYESEWFGFGAMRTKVFRYAQEPWILWLDADEIVTDGLLSSLRQLFRDGATADAYQINRMVHFMGKRVRHGDWFPDWNTRLFRSTCWEMDERPVHETIRVTGRVGRLRGLLEHHSYRDWSDRRARAERYAELWAAMEVSRGRRPRPGEAAIRGLWRFVRGYLLRLGVRDGLLGLRIAASIASETRLKYRLLRKGSDR